MKKLILILLFALSAPLVAQSAWVGEDGKPIADTESMRSDGNFGVQLVLTPDENQFRQMWNASTPKLSSANSVRRGSSLAAMLIFSGCAPNKDGVCDVVAEFILESPDGKKTPAGEGIVWSSAPLQEGFLQLGLASMKAGFDSKDTLGNYKVIANVKDKIAGRTLQLTAGFKVTK
jgi:hypothetical protein